MIKYCLLLLTNCLTFWLKTDVESILTVTDVSRLNII